MLLKHLELLLFMFQGTFFTYLFLFFSSQPGCLFLKSILLDMLFPEQSCAVLTVKLFLFLLSPCLNAFLSLSSHSILNFRGSHLGTFTPYLIIVKDFILLHLVKLGHFVGLRNYLIQVFQLFLLKERASDCRISLLHLIYSLVMC